MRPPDDPPPWRLLAWWIASLAAALAHNSLWATPNLAFVSLIASEPGTNPFGDALAGDYLLTDVSLTSAAWVLGQVEPHEIARLHLVVLVVGWGLVVVGARMRFGHAAARNLTVLLAASPLVTVSMQWLGQPDPLTALCGIAMVLVRRWWAVVALGVLAGLTHPEQAVFMAAAAGTLRAFLPAADREHTRVDWRVLGAGVGFAVGGVALGRLATEVWFRLSDVVINTPRTDFLDYGLGTFLDHHTQHPWALLWSLWGPIWLLVPAVIALVVAGTLRSGRPTGGRIAALVGGLVALAACVPVFVTLDETRVYAVITAPLVAFAALWLAAVVPERISAWACGALLAVSALLPGVMVTGISTWRSQLDAGSMVAFLADGEVPDGGDLTAWLLEPFDFVIPEPPE